MAELTYNVAKLNLGKALNLETADLRVLLLKTKSGANDPDLATVSAVLATAAAEHDDGSYARVALGTVTGAQDDGNDRADFTVADADFGSLTGVAVEAALVFVHVTNDSDSYPVFYSDTNFPKTPNGAGFTLDLSGDLARIS